MRIVALMTVRNEENYLNRCIQHLISQGVDICLIDNGSTDKTREIASAYLGKGVLRIEEIPFNGEPARINAQIMAIGVRERVLPPMPTVSPSLTSAAACSSDTTFSCRLRSRSANLRLSSR